MIYQVSAWRSLLPLQHSRYKITTLRRNPYDSCDQRRKISRQSTNKFCSRLKSYTYPQSLPEVIMVSDHINYKIVIIFSTKVERMILPVSIEIARDTDRIAFSNERIQKRCRKKLVEF